MRKVLPRARWAVPVAAGLVSCLHSLAPKVPPSQTLRLSESASGPHGRAPLTVVAAGPRGVVNIGSDPGITLVFNRSMRPVQSSPTAALPAIAVTTQEGKPVEGQWRWVGTHGLLFQPARSLPGATRFYVTVPHGTRALDASRLGTDYTLEFATDTARVSRTFPDDRSRRLMPHDALFLKFTQPVDPAELQKHLRLVARSPNEKLGRDLPVAIRTSAPQGAARANLDDTELSREYAQTQPVTDDGGLWLQVIPTQPLPLDSELELTLSKGLHSLQGTLPTEEPFNWSPRTYGPLHLDDVKCARQNLGRCQAHRDFTVVLSNPVAPDEFRRFLKIEGPTRQSKPTKAAKPKSLRAATEHALALDPEYGDRFKITLRAGMTDLYGQKLPKNVSVSLAIEEPYTKPSSTPRTASNRTAPDGDSGDNESDAQSSNGTEPRRARLSYDLAVGVRGNILEALGGPGGNAGNNAYKLPISAINVPSYGLYTKALSEWSLVREIGKNNPSDVTNSTWSWFSTGANKNIRTVRQLDVKELLDGKSRGAAVVALAGLGQLDSQVSSLINVTDLGVTARVSRFGSIVWLTHLSTGEPAAEATATIYDANGDAVCSGQTDGQGLITFSAQQLKPIARNGTADSRLLLVARAGDDFTYQRLEPSSTIFSDAPTDYLQRGQWAGLIFTDRGVYRPGEKVKLGGFFRHTAEKGFSVLAKQEFRYVVNDAQGEMVASGDGKLDPFGALSADVSLTKSAALGHATASIRFGRRDEEQFSAGFQILSYKPAEFKVSVQPRQREAVHRQSATFDVSSEYLFGSPVTEASVRQYVTRTEVNYEPPGSRGYIVDDATFRQDLRFVSQRGSAYSEDVAELDSKGTLSRTVALDAPQQSKPEQLVFEAEVQDLSHQTQASRSQVLVHPAKFYLALKEPKQRFLATGAMFPANVLALSPRGTRLANIPISLELWRRTWNSVVEDKAADALHYKTHVHDVKAVSCMVTSADHDATCPLRLTEPGYYILRATSQDDLANPVAASVGLYVVDDRANSTATATGWQPTDRRKLDLELDQKSYQPGDVARILVKSPFKQATALVTVERAGLLDQKVQAVRGSLSVIEVPVKAEYFPNAYVSVHLVRGRVANMPEIGAADVGAPDYRVGYASLRVDPESHRLQVAVSTPRAEYRPGDSVDAQVALQRTDGAPSAGTVTFYVVDEGVLLLTGYKTPDPLPAFSEPRSLGVYALESRERLAHFIKWRNGEHISILGYETEGHDSNSDKGSEVGGGMDMPGRIRSDFRTTVHFEAGRAVGNDGKAQFHFKLPDNLTSFRLMAVAAGADDRFGFGEASIQANRQLMARPALPRIVRVGDTLQAGVIVTSKGAKSSGVDVSLAASGLTPLGPLQKHVTLPQNGQVEVRFPVKATVAGTANFEFSAKSSSDVDRVRVSRKVEQPLRWLSASAFGSTNSAAAIALGDLSGYRKDLGDLSVTVSPSALVGLKSVFDGLSAYPYGCTEQLASRVLPLVAAAKLAEQQQVRLTASTSSDLDAAIGEIAKRQRSDGSFGYWEDDNSSHPWLTAYALLTLERASQAGYFVPKRLRDQAVQNLTSELDRFAARQSAGSRSDEDTSDENSDNDVQTQTPTQSPGEQTRSPADMLRFTSAQAAFIADVLSQLGQLDQSRVHQLLAVKDSLSLSAKIQVLSAMSRLHLPRPQLDALLAEVLKEVTVGPAEARVETSDPSLAILLESPTRSTAMLLQAVLAMDNKNPLVEKLARGLVRLRTGAGYRNTQEDAWALLALEEYRRLEEPVAPQFTTQVFLGDSLAGDASFHGPSFRTETTTIAASTLFAQPSSAVSLKVSGQGTAHYSMLLKLAKDGASSQALDEGFSIEKHLRAIDPAHLKQLENTIPDSTETRAQVGQLVLVDLLLETAEARDQIVLDDPLPAGLEPVEFGFATSAQSLASVEQTPVVTSSSGHYGRTALRGKVHREMHDDHVLHFIEHLDPGIHHFRYLTRATSLGQFVTPPTRAACMYDTEIVGQNGATVFEVTTH
jgi:alpha-2-macroglobulin